MGVDILVVIPVAILVVLSLVRFKDPGPALLPAVLVCAAVFGGFLIVRAALPDERIWPNSEVARRNRWLQNHLLKMEDWEKRPVVILSGSSSTYYGVDAELLEKLLAENGTPSTVLSFCMPGNTHPERQFMLESFLSGLSAEDKQKLEETNVLFLGEVFDEYDRNPLYRFSKEAFSERAILFLNPENSLRAWEAYGEQLKEDDSLPRFETMSLLLQHVLLNRFCAGAFASMRPTTKLKKTPPFFPLEGSKDTFNYERAVQSMSTASAETFPHSEIPFPQWTVMDSQLRRLMRPYVDGFGYYCLPVLEPSRVNYQKSFLASQNSEVPRIEPPDSRESEVFLVKEHWFDGVHPTKTGAIEVTRWVAGRIGEMLPEVFDPHSKANSP